MGENKLRCYHDFLMNQFKVEKTVLYVAILITFFLLVLTTGAAQADGCDAEGQAGEICIQEGVMDSIQGINIESDLLIENQAEALSLLEIAECDLATSLGIDDSGLSTAATNNVVEIVGENFEAGNVIPEELVNNQWNDPSIQVVNIELNLLVENQAEDLSLVKITESDLASSLGTNDTGLSASATNNVVEIVGENFEASNIVAEDLVSQQVKDVG